MNHLFQSTLKYLYDLQFFGMKLGLGNTRKLLEYLGNPHNAFPAIHVAGTNGKGSTCAMLNSIFHAAGYKTGLYTSPHLFHFSERIKINEAAISEEDIVRLTNKMRAKIDELKCTFFEATTAMAFEYFRENEVDIAIIETGLGGRLDATNVIDPLLAVITNIDLEHTEHLGKTIESIAFEKAGIIKPGTPCLIGLVKDKVKNIFKDAALSGQSSAYFMDTIADMSNIKLDLNGSQMDLKINLNGHDSLFDNLRVGLAGQHQLNNAALAVSAALIQKQFQISEKAIREGLKNVEWNARLQMIRSGPCIIADAAHNPAGMRVLAEAIRSIYKPQFKKLYLIIGMLADKDHGEALRIIAPYFNEIFTVTPENERALKAETLAENIRQIHSEVKAVETLELAMIEMEQKMTPNDMLLVTGSHFVLSKLKNIRRVS